MAVGLAGALPDPKPFCQEMYMPSSQVFATGVRDLWIG